MRASIAVIGGSGFYEMEGLSEIEEAEVETPFGSPSGAVRVGTLSGRRAAFLPRHGRGHTIPPSALNVRANIYALKTLGVRSILSFSAVGSLREELKPGDFVIPDQLFDHTKGRASSFFDEGLAAHVSFSDPFCSELRTVLAEACAAEGEAAHSGGTYICIEGPQFSTKAESKLYRQWGMDIIGMTAATEAKLAREAEICYAALAAVTDYDVWHPDHESVTAEMVLQNLLRNVDAGKRVMRAALRACPDEAPCGCRDALRSAFATDPAAASEAAKRRLQPLLEKYPDYAPDGG